MPKTCGQPYVFRLPVGRCFSRKKTGRAGAGARAWVAALVLAAAVLLILGFSSVSQALRPFRIGTGGSTGVYYPIGKSIAAGLTTAAAKQSSALAGRIGVAQNSAGSIENVRAVIAGELEAGMVQADIAAQANGRLGEFAGFPDSVNIRAIAALYSEKFQLVVRKDAGISGVGDLKGKRISVDELGSGTRTVMNSVLNAYALTEDDLLPLYLKPAFTEDKMKSGELQGFAMMAGAPNVAVSRLLESGITLVPVDPAVATAINLRHRYLFPGKIARGTYAGVPDVPTLEVWALLVVSSTMADTVAHAVAEALFSPDTLQHLHNGHPLGKNIALESALQGLSIPLHPGAAAYYRDRGLVLQ